MWLHYYNAYGDVVRDPTFILAFDAQDRSDVAPSRRSGGAGARNVSERASESGCQEGEQIEGSSGYTSCTERSASSGKYPHRRRSTFWTAFALINGQTQAKHGVVR